MKVHAGVLVIMHNQWQHWLQWSNHMIEGSGFYHLLAFTCVSLMVILNPSTTGRGQPVMMIQVRLNVLGQNYQ